MTPIPVTSAAFLSHCPNAPEGSGGAGGEGCEDELFSESLIMDLFGAAQGLILFRDEFLTVSITISVIGFFASFPRELSIYKYVPLSAFVPLSTYAWEAFFALHSP